MGFAVEVSAHHNGQQFLFRYSTTTVLSGFVASTVNFQASFVECRDSPNKEWNICYNTKLHYRKPQKIHALQSNHAVVIKWNNISFRDRFHSLSRQSITLQKPASWNFAEVIQSTELTASKTDRLSEFSLIDQTTQFFFFLPELDMATLHICLLCHLEIPDNFKNGDWNYICTIKICSQKETQHLPCIPLFLLYEFKSIR